jgi:hypothetical protein
MKAIAYVSHRLVEQLQQLSLRLAQANSPQAQMYVGSRILIIGTYFIISIFRKMTNGPMFDVPQPNSSASVPLL